MKKCRYCDKPLPAYVVKARVTFCPACGLKRDDAKRFVKVCDEFKKQINYDEIKRKREKEAQENDQRTTASI